MLVAVLAASVIIPLIGSSPARADTGTSEPLDDEYEIPDGIGSLPWW